MRLRRSLVPLLLVLTGSSAAARADDAPSAEACVAAHHEAQRQRRDNHPVEARALLLACTREHCPALIRSDCADWLVAVDRETPTLVIEPRTRSGEPVVGARATVDGAPFAAVLDGKALPIDPGEHVVRVDAESRPSAEQRTIVVAGERAQRVVVVLEDARSPSPRPPSPGPALLTTPPPPPRDAPARSGRSNVVPIALGAVGVVGLGSFTAFGLSGRSVKSDLDASGCRPHCDPSRVDDMWRRFTIADVSLAIAVVALGAAAVYLVAAR